MSWMLSCIGCGSKKLAEREETKVLDFQHYSLTAVPPYVFECERFLEELYLDFNQISELPKELFLCNELQILSLSDNDLHNLPPAISSLNNLLSLDLSKNGISDIPDNIKSCKRLCCVNASTNPLCRLPEGFTQLVSLKELSLSDTFLEYLPANFGRLTGLEVLDLRENQLNTLPRSMTRLTALKRLDLGQNEFTELPEVVGHLTNLMDLWLDNNRIKTIPSEIGNLVKLSFLDASKNRINEIHSRIGCCKGLSDLYLTRNELEELPGSICQCTKIATLHVDDNHLDHLPENIGSLDHLVELKVSQNELSSLPSSFGLLRSLQFLHVDENGLSTLPSELGSCVSLIVITAAHNKITDLPAEMGSLSCLRVLNLCGNIIQSLPVSFSKLHLRALWLSENQAKPSVPLQCTNNTMGQKVLTCFMLPQTPSQGSTLLERDEDDDRPLTEAEIEARRARSLIHFAADGDAKPSGRLTRVPTPYPKELRALAKHTKNILALKKEKEKETPLPPPQVKNSDVVVKDAEKIDSSVEKSGFLTTLKSSTSSIQVTSNVAFESAIKNAPAEKECHTVQEINSPISSSKTKDAISLLVCQDGAPPSSPKLEVEFHPTSSGKVIGRREMEKDSLRSISNQPLLQNLRDMPEGYLPSCISKSSEAPSTYKGQSDSMKTESVEDQPSFLRPASIAVVEPSLPGNITRDNYPQRPGSLALEGVIPPWQNQRPGSLAAPINTVGIPMVSPSKRASSQNALHGMNTKSTPNFKEHWKPYHSPTRINVKEGLSPQALIESREDVMERTDETDLDISLPYDTIDSAPLSALEVEALNEKNLSLSAEDAVEVPNARLASTISKVTKEDYETVTDSSLNEGLPLNEKEKNEGPVNSSTTDPAYSSNKSFDSHSSENLSYSQNGSDLSAKCPSFIAWNSNNTKIPKASQFSPTYKGAYISSPKMCTYETTTTFKSSNAEPLSRPPTNQSSPSYPSDVSFSFTKSSVLSPSGISGIQYTSNSSSFKSSITSPSDDSEIQPLSQSSNISSKNHESSSSGIDSLSYSFDDISPVNIPVISSSAGIQSPSTSSSMQAKISVTSSSISSPSYSSSIPSVSPKSPTFSPSRIQPPLHYSNPSASSVKNLITPPSGIQSSSDISSPQAKSPVMPSGIQPPSYSSSINVSKLPSDKIKSNIPMLTSPVAKKEFSLESKSPTTEDRPRGRTPPKENQHSRTPPKEIRPLNKEIGFPKSFTRIPMVPSQSPEADTKEPSVVTPNFARSPSQTDRDSFIPIKKGHVQPIVSPNFVRSPSQTDRDSFIPVKKGDVQPKLSTALSPTDKPINQTGIPILSPSESTVDKSTSRIPTFTNSSLRGKKSGIPSPSEREMKYAGAKRLGDDS